MPHQQRGTCGRKVFSPDSQVSQMGKSPLLGKGSKMLKEVVLNAEDFADDVSLAQKVFGIGWHDSYKELGAELFRAFDNPWVSKFVLMCEVYSSRFILVDEKLAVAIEDSWDENCKRYVCEDECLGRCCEGFVFIKVVIPGNRFEK